MKNIANLKLALLGMKARDQFGFGFGQVERRAVRLRDGRVKNRRNPSTCGIGAPIKFQRGKKPQWNPCCDKTICSG